MALPSQAERTGELGRTYAARSRGRTRPFKGAGLNLRVLAIGGGIIAGAIVLGMIVLSKPGSGGSPLPGPASARAENTSKPAREPATPPRSTLEGVRPLASNPPASHPASPVGARTEETGPLGRALEQAGKPGPVDVTSPTGSAAPAPAPASPAPAIPAAAIPATGSTESARRSLELGLDALNKGDPVAARVLLSRVVLDAQASADDRRTARERLAAVNEDLVFSATVRPGDPLTESYTVRSGDQLGSIVSRRGLAVDWRLISRVNKVEPTKLREGRSIKLVRGPFHAIVAKSEYRLDLFAGAPDEPERWLYIRSFPVGLGAGNSTPTGTFVIKKHSKLVNPPWVNPQTGERFAADDPKNPIGEHWLGWEGVGDAASYTGFGLHGTIEPGSIGKQMSMGCVRMLPADIALVYECLVEQISVVKVVP